MSEKKSPQESMQDWQALQQQYWGAWSDATRQMTGQPPPATPWQEGIEQWSRMFGNSGQQSETAERMLGSAKGYVALMQSMLAAATGQGGGSAPMQGWTDALRGGFNMPGLDPSLFNNPMAAMLQGIRGDGTQGFDQLAQSFAPFLAQAKQEGKSWLQVPAFGFAREHQEQYQKSIAAFVEYQEALKGYNEVILKVSRRSFEIFETKLSERAEPGRQIESLRALYDVWVDAAEEAYAEIALSEEFRKVYGDVVNAQMRVRSHVQAEVERVGAELGAPTRTELNSVHKRLHELRRELRAGGSGGDAATQIRELRDEVRRLREQLDVLRGGAAREPAPSARVAEPKRAEARKQGQHAPRKHTPEPTAIQKKQPAKPSRKRAAAVARPRTATKKAASFKDAISTMRSTVVDSTKVRHSKRRGGKP